ncbi:hypothetical protein ACA910_006668 [Epithemia clementina (nom. ined.)]
MIHDGIVNRLLLLIYCWLSYRDLVAGWQQQPPCPKQSRRAFITNNVVAVAGIWVGAADAAIAAVHVDDPASDQLSQKQQEKQDWFQTKMQPATEDRPAIPLPSVTPREQKALPPVQGVIYGPSVLPTFGTTSSSYLLVEVLLPTKASENNSNNQHGSDVVQAARIPMSQIMSFPFRFQFTKLTKSISDDQDLMVRAKLQLDFGGSGGGEDATIHEESLFCSYLIGEGVAKALLLPSSAASRSSKQRSPSSEETATTTTTITTNDGIFIRAPAAVRLGPVDIADDRVTTSCSATSL